MVCDTPTVGAGGERFTSLEPELQEKVLSIRENFLSSCGCEAYYGYTCNRCRRLAKQSPEGDVLQGEVITGMFLYSLGLIDDQKYAPPPGEATDAP